MACTANTPLEKTLEADIPTLRKTGHFYFALTRIRGAKGRIKGGEGGESLLPKTIPGFVTGSAVQQPVELLVKAIPRGHACHFICLATIYAKVAFSRNGTVAAILLLTNHGTQ